MKQENRKPIYITKPVMPPLKEFEEYLNQIWESRILTNGGPFHNRLEKELSEFLGVKYISLFSNGTLALITALQTLRITGEVITTPFSFVATTHALWWNGIKPVFADIESKTFTIDPLRIEAAITPKTTAIMPVHVYGNPCNMIEIQRVADTYGLKVIYDSAHAFNVKVNNVSILNLGDLSVLSFHATKVYNTIEGGAIVCHDEKTKARIDFLKNFGYAGETTVIAPGINAKMNELQAAYGLLQLKSLENAINQRHSIVKRYREKLTDIKGIQFLGDIEGVNHNYAYFPILVNHEQFGISRDELYDLFRKEDIYARKYFYPLISDFPTYRGLDSAQPGNLPIAARISQQVLCLPLYPEMTTEEIDKVSAIIIEKKQI